MIAAAVELKIDWTKPPPRAWLPIKRKARKNGWQPQTNALLYAQYVMVLTTFPEENFSAEQILEYYRYRWQIELVFKRFKQIAQLGHLPKYHDDSAKAWLYGKLFVALLTEKLIQHARAVSPWGYQCQRSVKTSHFLERKTAPRDCPGCGTIGACRTT